MNKKKLLIGSAILLLAVIIGYVVIFVFKSFNKAEIISSQNSNSQKDTKESYLLSGNQIQWMVPTLSTGLGLAKNSSDEAESMYFKVGTVLSGKYKSGIIYMVNMPSSVMGDYTYRFINLKGDNLLLAKHSYELYDDDPLDRSKFSVDKSTVLSDLIFPKKIYHGKDSFSFEGDNISEKDFTQYVKLSDVNVAFVDPKLGKVYMDDFGGTNLSGGVKQNGLYLIAPDGTIRIYSLDINFFNSNDNVPKVIWSNGITNTAEYTNTDRSGCGSRNYASVQRDILMKDLNPIGKTVKGDAIYELKDTDNKILQDIYNNQYYPYNTQKISYSQFIQSKPVFFWLDSFDRLIKFQKTEFLPVAECGKPVIYLYPEKTTNVSVLIEPKGGLTKTEPAYGNGWNVIADPSGQLTDLNSGEKYPYLFWEGRGGIYSTPEKGFVVSQQEVHSFLVEKLTKLGLNQKEQSDFIDFWEPRMTGAPYFFVTFLGNKEMDSIAPLSIVPKPDSVIRILMDFSPLQKPIFVEGYDIKTPSRNGFTVVEWGGVIR